MARTKQDSIPLYLTATATIATVTTAGLWWLLRRPCKYLTTQDLPPTVSQDIDVVRELSEEERLVIKTAFLAGDDFRWMVAGSDYKTNLNEKQHRDGTFSIVEYFIAFSERYGHMLVCRDKDGTFLGAIGLIPPYQRQKMFTVHFYRTIIPLGMPAAMKMGEGPSARCEAFQRVETEHKETMKEIPHWYVQIIGVSDKAQGKGVGKKLMEAAFAMSDGMPMCLGCHNGNVAFYEKLGFTVAKNFEIVPKGIEDTSTFEMNCMVRGV